MEKGIRITTQGEITEVGMPVCSDSRERLHWMQEQVGGHIETVHPAGLPRPYVMIVDEEGLLKEDPQLNVTASLLYGYLQHGQPIVGDVLILREKMTPEGLDLAGIRDEDLPQLTGMLRDFAGEVRA